MKASLGLLACLCLMAAACTSAADQVAPSTLPLVEVASTTTTTIQETTRRQVTTEPEEFAPDADGIFERPTSTTTTTVPPTTAAPKVTTPKAGRPAVTQPSGSPQSPSALYQGELGFYTLDQVFATSPVARPNTAPGTFPLLGLPGGSNKPAVVVKIDNASKARPHVGLNKADIVFEEEVEFGITRLAAVFHSTETTVGPVRSGRSTDISFLNGFGTPALVYSGANKVIDRLLLNQVNVANFSAARSSGYWRERGRRAPHNLFTRTSSFSGVAPGGPPPAQFHYRPAGTPGTQGVPAAGFGVHYPANKVRWDWAGTHWTRKQGGKAHITDGQGVAASNVVVVAVRSVGTGLFDSTGAPVPEFVFVGEGPAVVYTDGRRVDGRWVRPTLRDPAILHVGGEPIMLTPGRTWVEITTSGQFIEDK